MKKTFTGIIFEDGIKSLKNWDTSITTLYHWMQAHVYHEAEESAKKHAKNVKITIEIEEPFVSVGKPNMKRNFDTSA